ncbi:MAG: response regulator [Spirochaetes bacterium]|nr:response regulator [Spirochaetota bacterium]
MIRWIKTTFLSKYNNESYITRQKAFILFLVSLIFIPLLVIPIVVNIATDVSTHPSEINYANAVALAGLAASLFLLWNGRHTASVIIVAACMTIRIIAGIVIKLDTVALTGSNNNVFFIFIALAFASLFGGRRLLAFMAGVFIVLAVAGAFIIPRHYPGANTKDLFGATLNLIIAIVGVASLSYLITSITDTMFKKLNAELETNKNLGENLSTKVQELEAMYEEMESMNEELSHTYGELLDANKDLGIFKKFVDEAGQGFCIAKTDGTLVYLNPALLRIIGSGSLQEAIGTNTRDYYAKESRARIKNEIMPRVHAEGQWMGELPIRTVQGGEIATLQNIFFIRDERDRPINIATIVSDITERKKLEERLTRAQKMEALGRLTGGIAHDYNNILTAILGFGQILKSEMDPEDPRAKLVDEIVRAGTISAGITRQLLAFGKNQLLKPNVIDLNDSIRNLEKMLRRFTGESIELVLRLGRDVRPIFADPAQIDQVLLNLVINACDAMPSSGTLAIETGNADIDDESNCSLPDAHPGSYAFVAIEDTGTGMAKDTRDQMFEPFFSTKPPEMGTGLGLSVVYGIVRQHGGWIDVSSERKKGTSIKVFLPAASSENSPVEPITETKEDSAGGGGCILLVEDHNNVRAFASRVLRDKGYTVIEAGGAKEAIIRFSERDGDIDLLFSDVVLPGKNGIQLAEELMSMNPRLKVLLSSGYTGQRSQIDTIAEKNYPFLQKPYSMHDLIQSINTALQGGRQ